MTLKDRIENNLTLYILGIAAASFGAGLAGHKLLIEISAVSSGTNTDWSAKARSASWIPKSECPAYPVNLKITSPGSDSIIGLNGSNAYLDLVIQSSRPVMKPSTVGLVIRENSNSNHYVIFPAFTVRSNDSVFRDETFTLLPFRPEVGSNLTVWAFLTDDRAKFGSTYTSLEQLKFSAPDLAISPPVSVITKAK